MIKEALQITGIVALILLGVGIACYPLALLVDHIADKTSNVLYPLLILFGIFVIGTFIASLITSCLKNW